MAIKEMKKTLLRIIRLKRILLLLLFPIALILVAAAKSSMHFAEEIYAKGVYKIYSQVFSSITGVFPFSLAETGIIFAIILVPAVIVLWIIRIIKMKEQRLYIISIGIINVLCLSSLIYFMLMLGCGINYYRQPFSYYSGLEVQNSTVDELYGLCSELAVRTNEVREQLLNEDEAGVYKLEVSNRQLAVLCKDAYTKLGKEYPVLAGFYPITKQVMFSSVMSRTELTGMFVPFTMEANVNVDVSAYSIASTMCHEMAHLRGFIKEDEANYISYLVCTASDSLDVQYSGLMEALIVSGNALYAKDSDLYYEVRTKYFEGIERDLRANSVYWSHYHDTKVSQAADKLNDTYLKANNQTDGVQSYGRMVDLLLAEYRKNHQ